MLSNGKISVYFRGPFRTLSGYGVHARQVLEYFLAHEDVYEIFAENINWGACSFIHECSKLQKYYELEGKYHNNKDRLKFDLSVQVTIPNEFKRCAAVNVGVTAGIEVDNISPQWILKAKEVDMIVVPSEFSRKSMTETIAQWTDNAGKTGLMKIEIPVTVIPEWFEKLEGDEKSLDLDFSTKFNFLTVAQWGKGGFGEDRKDIGNMIRHFFQTFKDEETVGLVMKLCIVNHSEADLTECIRRIEEIKSNFKNPKCKLHLVHDMLSDEQMHALYSHPKISAYLSLGAECWGLPIIEAHAHGLPVLAVNWGGPLDFLREKQGFIPLEYDMKEIAKDTVWPGVLEQGTKWARVRYEDFDKKLTKFFKSSYPIKKQAQENVAWLKENFSREVVIKKYEKLFEELLGLQPTNIEAVKNPIAGPVTQLRNILGIDYSNDKEKVLFYLPQSFGDVLIATAIVDSLISSRHMDSDFYFATSPQFFEVLSGLKKRYPNFNIVAANEMMMSADIAKEVFDVVYNPTVNLQYQFSNWLLGNGKYAVKLFEQIAKDCNLHPNEITDYVIDFEECPIPEGSYFVFSPTGTKKAKTYDGWQDVISNLKRKYPGVIIVQTGTRKEKLYDEVEDYRGKTVGQLAHVIKNADLFFGVDSFPGHLAAAVATPHLILFGNTTLNVSPLGVKKKTLQVLLETADRHGCRNACFKDECHNKRDGRNCISEIEPQAVLSAINLIINKINEACEEEDGKTEKEDRSEQNVEV